MGQQTCSGKGQIVKNFDSVGHAVTVLTVQLCTVAWKQTRQNINEWAWLYARNKAGGGQVWFVSHDLPTPAFGEHLFICLRAICISFTVNCLYLLTMFFMVVGLPLNALSALYILTLCLLHISHIFLTWHLSFGFAYSNFFHCRSLRASFIFSL